MPITNTGRRRLAVGVLGAVAVLLGPWAVVQVLGAPRVHHANEAGDIPVVGLVLGAAVLPDGSPSQYLRARLDVADELYRAGRLQALVLSGETSPGYSEPAAMRAYLLGKGIPTSKLVEDPAGLDTHDSCVRVKRVYGTTRVTLVSQGYHLPRAVLTCRAAGVEAVGVGDWSVQGIGPMQSVPVLWRLGWSRFAVREVPAAWKMVFDVAIEREPTLGPPSDEVQRALR